MKIKRNSNLKIMLTYIGVAVVIVIMLFLCYSVNHRGKGVLMKYDLRGKDAYIHNATCSETGIIRPVESEAVYQELISICTNAVRYRESYADDDDSDYMLGVPDDPFIYFVKGDIRYEITLISIDKESLDFESDEPLISVSLCSKDKRDEETMDGRYYICKWFSYCFLSSQDYERLCELVLTYSDGEEMTWRDVKRNAAA